MAAAVPKLLRGPSPFPEDVPYAAIFRNALSASRPREPQIMLRMDVLLEAALR
jgi:hypothetical protein